MRLLNIETGDLLLFSNKQLKLKNIKYIAISHRWLPDEIGLLDLDLVGIGNNINIGVKLYNDLYSKIIKLESHNALNIQTQILKNIDIENINNQKNQKWNSYLKLESIIKENYELQNIINNHFKLLKIINNVINNEKNKFNEDSKYEKIKYVWLDTLCIDKTSSAELSENLVSMYNIYKNAKFVHAHLVGNYNTKIFEKDIIKEAIDIVKNKDNISKEINKMLSDEWFTRCCTLQEYIANINLEFYNNNSNFIINKYIFMEYYKLININTIIKNGNNLMPSKYYWIFICGNMNLPCKIILSWVDERKTEHMEDKAYSLMGLLNTYIYPLYGEGENAMIRLIKEYTSNICDLTIFDWINYDSLFTNDKTQKNNLLMNNNTDNLKSITKKGYEYIYKKEYKYFLNIYSNNRKLSILPSFYNNKGKYSTDLKIKWSNSEKEFRWTNLGINITTNILSIKNIYKDIYNIYDFKNIFDIWINKNIDILIKKPTNFSKIIGIEYEYNNKNKKAIVIGYEENDINYSNDINDLFITELGYGSPILIIMNKEYNNGNVFKRIGKVIDYNEKGYEYYQNNLKNIYIY